MVGGTHVGLLHISVNTCLIAAAALRMLVEDRPASDQVKKRESQSEEYKLVWHDEFDQDGRPNPQNWTYETGFVRNKELQWYQPENAWCENGMLIIVARRENKANRSFDSNSTDWRRNRQYAAYTSASLTTQGLHSWQYGRFEMRARIDTRPGLWPAFWTLGVEGQWPNNGEIDIRAAVSRSSPSGTLSRSPSANSRIRSGPRSSIYGEWIGRMLRFSFTSTTCS